MSRQGIFYQKNREKILAAKKMRYQIEHPQKIIPKSPAENIVPKTDIDRILDQLDRERSGFL